MSDDATKHAAEVYLGSTLAEALRVIANLKGDAFVDEFLEKVYRTYHAQNAMLEKHDTMIPADFDRIGREAVAKSLKRARRDPTPL